MKKLFCLGMMVALLATFLPVFPRGTAQAADCPEPCFDCGDDDGVNCVSGCCTSNRDKSTRCCDELSQVSSGECFIATASGESRANLEQLHWLRDRVLTQEIMGEKRRSGILYLYYDMGLGESLAPVVAKSPQVAAMVRFLTTIMANIVSTIRQVASTGPDPPPPREIQRRLLG
jgi:hypothetical protein